MSEATTVALSDFLLARIAEDEAEVGAPFGYDDSAGPNGLGWAEVGALSEVLICSAKRARTDCATRRRIVERWDESDGPDPHDSDVGCPDCANVRDLAAVYADHPDYRDEWRP